MLYIFFVQLEKTWWNNSSYEFSNSNKYAALQIGHFDRGSGETLAVTVRMSKVHSQLPFCLLWLESAGPVEVQNGTIYLQ